MFFENRIKKEYRNEQIVRKKDEISRLAKLTTIASQKRIKVFPEIEGNKYYDFTARWNYKQCTKRKTF